MPRLHPDRLPLCIRQVLDPVSQLEVLHPPQIPYHAFEGSFDLVYSTLAPQGVHAPVAGDLEQPALEALRLFELGQLQPGGQQHFLQAVLAIFTRHITQPGS